MANIIKPKRSNTAGLTPTTSNLASGEMGVNMADQKMYINNGTSVVQIGAGNLSGLDDVAITTPTSGQSLSYNGTNWVNSSAGAGDVVGPASSTDNALVRFDGTTGKLIQNGNITEDDNGNMSGILSQTFADGTAVTVSAGKMWYNGTTGSWNMGMGGGNITQQVGEETFIYGKASSAITEGQLIVKTGAVGASGVITFAPSPTGLTDNDGIIGVATENIALNGFGRITTFGVVHGIDATGSSVGETWADGDQLYYNPSYVGGLTNVKPSSPYAKVAIATVTHNGSGGSGSIQVNIIYGSKLGASDSNVQTNGLASGNTLIYDAVVGYWKNANISAGTGVSVTNGAGSITIGNTGVTSITGTANEVDVSASTGGVTISLPATINANLNGNASTATTATNQSGGTVSATTGSFSGQITSTVATGTAPMVVSSTTKVANLNVEQVDGYHADTANTASTIAVRDASKNLSVSGVALAGSTSGTTTLVASATAGTTTATLPATTGTLITTGDTGTVTNTMLAGSIANNKLANSSITINGSAISLGGSTSVGTVTSVSGTAPISVATGTTTPAISISQASSTTNGYLSSTDWNTFNNKTSNTGTVTSVSATVPTGLSISGSPITTSGTLAITYTAGYSIPTTASQTNWDSAYTQRLQWDGGSTNLVASTGRTSLGGTTVGQNFFTLTNPTAVTFPRINADNTVSALDATTFRSAIGAGTGSGTVTSVTGGSYLTGGTITTSGTLAVDATSTNTASKVVARDASGNFSAGTITATLSGNATTATSATTATNQSGGTVNATTGAFSGVITSTVATGTAPLTIASTTAVTNLNADYLDGQHGSYYQPASTAITTSNIGSQSVNYATTAGNGGVTSVNGSTGAVTLSVLPSGFYDVEYLVVAGGGGGGRQAGGGGGAGGFVDGTTYVSSGTAYTVTVGAGGAGQTSATLPTQCNGADSRFGNIYALGGGGGAGYRGNSGYYKGASGGSGGGGWSSGSQNNYGGGIGIGSQGTWGSNGATGGSYAESGGGGGGAGGAPAYVQSNATGGNGGAGAVWVNGTTYAGGGGAGASNYGAVQKGTGGAGGGGNGGDGGYTTITAGSAGTANTGGGGGGGGGSTGAADGGNGGSGIVIVRYAGSQKGSGGTVTSSGGYTYHTFTTSGTFTA